MPFPLSLLPGYHEDCSFPLSWVSHHGAVTSSEPEGHPTWSKNDPIQLNQSKGVALLSDVGKQKLVFLGERDLYMRLFGATRKI
jgi:hypothetical protein